MSEPLNRSQRILQFVAASKGPVTLAAISSAVAKGEPQTENHKRLFALVSANVSVLLTARKLTRVGERGAYLYSTTATAFVDGRRRAERPAKASPEAIPKPVPKATPQPPADRKRKDVLPPPTTPEPPPPPRPRSAFVNLGNKPRPAGQRETVEEFEARGGRIQKLAHGESSRPPFENMRAVDQASMRRRLTTALDTDPANTTDDDAVAA